jgi:hypothetical protein
MRLLRAGQRSVRRLNCGVMRPSNLSAFEAAVLQWIAVSSRDQALELQLADVAIAERDYTVVGCCSKLSVAEGAPLSTAAYSQRGPLDGPHFESKVVEHGGGTLLWFKAGRADCLEIYAHGNYFPSDHAELGNFKLSEGVSV